MNNADSEQPQVEKLQLSEQKSSKEQAVLHAGATLPTTPANLKKWFDSLSLPAPVSLAAVICAAFLIFPAYRGLVSDRIIRQQQAQIRELQQSLKVAKDRSLSLDMELSQRNIQSQARDPLLRLDSGLFISPLLSLEPKRSELPDLIRVSFAHSDQAILVFDPPKHQIDQIEVKLLQGQRLVWSQILSYTSQRIASPSLVTLVLSASALPPGNYQLSLDGDSAKQRVSLGQFDLTIEK
jgi:hypothetical protein